MLFDLFGIQVVNYKDKTTGNPTTARVLHIAEIDSKQSPTFRGRKTDNLFVGDYIGFTSLIDSLPVPSLIDISFGRRDSIDDIKLIEPSKK